MTDLVRYDEAKRALAVAVDVDDVLEIVDKMEALRAYGKQINDLDLEKKAAEIRIRAQRRFGELRKQLRKDGKLPGFKGGRPSKSQAKNWPDAEPVSRRQSKNASALAEIPEEAFEASMADQKSDGVPTTEKTLKARPKRVQANKVKQQQKAQTHFWSIRDAIVRLESAISKHSTKQTFRLLPPQPDFLDQVAGLQGNLNALSEVLRSEMDG